jgi:hypothetical protein
MNIIKGSFFVRCDIFDCLIDLLRKAESVAIVRETIRILGR